VRAPDKMKNAKQKPRSLKSLKDDKRGAVLVEFVVAFVPLMTVFFVFVQLSQLAVARLIVKHSAVVGARAAAVYHNEHTNVPEMCADNGKAKVDSAVRAAVGHWSDRITTTTNVSDSSNRDSNGMYNLVTVRVNAVVRCRVPLGRLMCPGGVALMTDVKSLPHQGARYKVDSCSGGGGGFVGGGGRSGGGGASGSFGGGGGDFGGGGAGGSF
jgi:Flp pilus assembly protein TadG